MCEEYLTNNCCVFSVLLFAGLIIFVYMQAVYSRKECTVQNVEKYAMFYIPIFFLLYQLYMFLWKQMLDFIPLISGAWNVFRVQVMEIQDGSPCRVFVSFEGKQFWVTILDNVERSLQLGERVELRLLPHLRYAFRFEGRDWIPFLYPHWILSVVMESILCILFSSVTFIASKRIHKTLKQSKAKSFIFSVSICSSLTFLLGLFYASYEKFMRLSWLVYAMFSLRFTQLSFCLLYVFAIWKTDCRKQITFEAIGDLGHGDG